MYCDVCGNKLRDGAKFCNKCGSSVTEMLEEIKNVPDYKPVEKNDVPDYSYSSAAKYSRADEDPYAALRASQPQRVYQQPIYRESRYYAPGTHPYHTLGGFLLFIVVMNYIGGVAGIISTGLTGYAYISIFKVFSRSSLAAFWVFSFIGSMCIMLASTGIMFSYANRIRRKESDFLGYIQSASLTMLGCCAVFYLIEILWIKVGLHLGSVNLSRSYVQIFIYFGVWILSLILNSIYFGSSVRVRTYMGSDSYLRQSVLNKGTISPIPADGSDLYHEGKAPAEKSFDPLSQWVCSQCNRINSNYITTCKCGYPKPQIDVSKSWVCKNCGTVNMGNIFRCSSCGIDKNEESTWVCSKCGAQNRGNSSICSVCYAAKKRS